MEKGDFIAVIDIQDAHRAVSINPIDSQRQGMSWRFKDIDTITYLKDNRLCMGLASIVRIFFLEYQTSL